MFSNLSKRSIISGIIMVLLAGLCLWAYFTSSSLIGEISFSTEKGDSNVSLKEVIITETKEGEKFWEVYATTGKYSEIKDLAILNNIRGNFYKNGDVVLSVIAPIAEYDSTNKEIRLKGRAIAANNKDVFIKADEIKWIGANDLVVAKGNVKIERNKEVLTVSEEASFDSDFTSLKLSGGSQTFVYIDK